MPPSLSAGEGGGRVEPSNIKKGWLDKISIFLVNKILNWETLTKNLIILKDEIRLR